jgi:hypothetical protein
MATLGMSNHGGGDKFSLFPLSTDFEKENL